MAQIIQIGKKEEKESGPPRIICPHCRQVIEVNLDIWKKDVSQLFKASCYKCHGEIFMGLIITSNSTLNGLLGTIKTIIEATNPKNIITG